MHGRKLSSLILILYKTTVSCQRRRSSSFQNSCWHCQGIGAVDIAKLKANGFHTIAVSSIVIPEPNSHDVEFALTKLAHRSPSMVRWPSTWRKLRVSEVKITKIKVAVRKCLVCRFRSWSLSIEDSQTDKILPCPGSCFDDTSLVAERTWRGTSCEDSRFSRYYGIITRGLTMPSHSFSSVVFTIFTKKQHITNPDKGNTLAWIIVGYAN